MLGLTGRKRDPKSVQERLQVGILDFIPISGVDALWDSGQEGYCDSEFLQSTLEDRGAFSTESTIIYSCLDYCGRVTLNN